MKYTNQINSSLRILMAIVGISVILNNLTEVAMILLLSYMLNTANNKEDEKTVH